MKKGFLIIAVMGLFAFASCTKHACPAYGTLQKKAPSISERA
jgi:hypothetical protein